jgi:hypothetical protein
LDWPQRLSIVGAVVGLILWQTLGPVLAVVSVIVADCFAFYPTFEKVWRKPKSEPLSAWVIYMTGAGITLFSIKEWTILSGSVPVFLVLISLALVLLIKFRTEDDIVQ